jgi:hypothetical protein
LKGAIGFPGLYNFVLGKTVLCNRLFFLCFSLFFSVLRCFALRGADSTLDGRIRTGKRGMDFLRRTEVDGVCTLYTLRSCFEWVALPSFLF